MAQALAIPVYLILSALLWLFIRRRTPERAGGLIAAYVLGVVLTLPALVFETAVYSYVYGNDTSVWVQLYAAFLATALVEELLLFFALYAEVRHARLLHTRTDVTLVSLFLAAGLALGGAALHLLSPAEGFEWLRALTGLPVSAVCGTLMGWWYGRTKVYPVAVALHTACAIVLPVLLHGLLEFAITAVIAGHGYGFPLLLCTLLPAMALCGAYYLRVLPGYGREKTD